MRAQVNINWLPIAPNTGPQGREIQTRGAGCKGGHETEEVVLREKSNSLSVLLVDGVCSPYLLYSSDGKYCYLFMQPDEYR